MRRLILCSFSFISIFSSAQRGDVNNDGVVAVALGATMVEKHFILNQSIGGPDAAFLKEIEEFAAMVSLFVM